MATNRRLFRLFLAVFLFLGLSFVSAQNSGYFIDTEGGAPRIFQRLAWSRSEYALRYEVVIEIGDGETYRDYRRVSATEPYIDISLQPGSYRFRVIPYDILNRPGGASEWKYIEVLPALQPEPFTASSEYITGGRDEPSGYLLNITGDNLDPEAEVFIRFSDGTRIAAETLDSGGASIRAFVESGVLIQGEYEIVIRNPGGLEAGISGVPVRLSETEAGSESGINISETESAKPPEPDTASSFLKPVMIGAELAYMQSFNVYGDYVSVPLSNCLVARANLLFYFPIGVYIGPELTGLFFSANYPDYYLPYGTDNFYSEDMPAGNTQNSLTVMLGANLLVRKWFSGERAALSFRTGMEFGILPDWVDQLNFIMDVSILLRLTDNLLLETGLAYSHLLLENSEGFFRPWLGIGFQY